MSKRILDHPILGKTEAHLKKLETLASNARSLGLDMNVVDAKTVKEICSYLSDDIIVASWCPTDGHANPMLTTLAYYKRSVEMGVRYFTGATVHSLKKNKREDQTGYINKWRSI